MAIEEKKDVTTGPSGGEGPAQGNPAVKKTRRNNLGFFHHPRNEELDDVLFPFSNRNFRFGGRTEPKADRISDDVLNDALEDSDENEDLDKLFADLEQSSFKFKHHIVNTSS